MIEMSFLAVVCLLTTLAPSWIDDAQANWKKTIQHRPTLLTVRSLWTWPNRIEHREYRLQRHGDDMLYYERQPKSRTTKEGPQQDGIRCLVLNDHYAFIVKKMAADSEWMLDSFGKSGDDVYNYVKRHMKIYEYINSFRGVMLETATLSELMSNDGFTVLSTSSDRGMQKGEFRNDLPKGYRSSLGFGLFGKRGAFWLDPAHNWRLDSFVLIAADGTERKHRFEYGDDGSSIPVGTELIVGDFKVTDDITYSFDDRFSEEDFRLTAFGLPEPEGMESSSNHFWYWGVAGVVLLVVGIWIVRRSR